MIWLKSSHFSKKKGHCYEPHAYRTSWNLKEARLLATFFIVLIYRRFTVNRYLKTTVFRTIFRQKLLLFVPQRGYEESCYKIIHIWHLFNSQLTFLVFIRPRYDQMLFVPEEMICIFPQYSITLGPIAIIRVEMSIAALFHSSRWHTLANYNQQQSLWLDHIRVAVDMYCTWMYSTSCSLTLASRL